jgi:putative nucleotidyltransferase with HDIG domain
MSYLQDPADSMGEKHILLADADAKTLEEFRQALGQKWMVTGVGTASAALEELKKQAYDGLVVSLNLADQQPAHLLSKVRSRFPKTARFVVAAEKDRERVVKELLGAHQFLIRPFDADGLQAAIERALAFEIWIDNDNLHKLVARMRTLPTVPALYLEILASLKSADTTTEDVGALIAKDMSITTKLLQVINSAYFGLPRTVTSPEEVVGLLGFETVKVMVIAIKLLNQYDRIKPADFSIDRLWKHSTAVANSARHLVLLQSGDRAQAEAAFAAGLLHDVGKVILAGNFADQYRGVQSMARTRHLQLWEVEREVFGASHCEIGAYLLGLWGLPLETLEAAALHHQPTRTANKVFSALTAVHVANVLERAVTPDFEGEVPASIDMDYLAEIGMVECLHDWCEEILGPEATEGYLAPPETNAKSCLPKPVLASAPPPSSTLTSSNKPANLEPCESSKGVEQPVDAVDLEPASEPEDLRNLGRAPNGVTSAAFAPDPSIDHLPSESPAAPLTPASPEFEPMPTDTPAAGRGNRWLYATAIAGLTMLVSWFVLDWQSRQKQQAVVVHAQPIKSTPAADSAEPAVTPTARLDSSPGEPSTLPGGKTNGVFPPDASSNSAATMDTASQAGVALGSATSLGAPNEPSFPDLKLQGILFSPRNASAIINGISVHRDDRVLGVRVLEIRPSGVIIEYQNRRKTLPLE